MQTKKILSVLREYVILTLSTLLILVGIYYFKFPNNFTFGGVTGLAVVLAKILPLSPSSINLLVNVLLLILGFVCLGKSFGIKTVYASTLLSVGLSVMDKTVPLAQPLTDDPMLELVFATALPAFGSAILFNRGASSGGTDIVAMIVKKHSSFDIGRALMLSDILITLFAFFVFDIKTVLFSILGLLAKSLVIDNVIESINLCKYFNVVCTNPKPICDYIVHTLKRSATVCRAQGAFTQEENFIIFTALRRYQAVQLRQYIREIEPGAFILISNTSEIIGKGFMKE